MNVVGCGDHMLAQTIFKTDSAVASLLRSGLDDRLQYVGGVRVPES